MRLWLFARITKFVINLLHGLSTSIESLCNNSQRKHLCPATVQLILEVSCLQALCSLWEAAILKCVSAAFICGDVIKLAIHPVDLSGTALSSLTEAPVLELLLCPNRWYEWERFDAVTYSATSGFCVQKLTLLRFCYCLQGDESN